MKSYPIYLLLSCYCLVNTLAKAQSDSIRTEYKTEDEQISRSEIQRVIRYITRANIEEKTLIKLGASPNSASFTRTGSLSTLGFDTELSIERKVTPSFSLLFGFDNQLNVNYYRDNAFSRLSPSPGQYPLWFPDRSFSVSSSLKAEIRYYYGMAKRIREGKSANNFSGTYVSFQARRPVLLYSKTRQRELITGEYRTETQVAPVGTLNTPSFALKWGIQQRIGRRGYIDLNAGPELLLFDSNKAYNVNNDSRTQLFFRINATVGLGW